MTVAVAYLAIPSIIVLACLLLSGARRVVRSMWKEECERVVRVKKKRLGPLTQWFLELSVLIRPMRRKNS